MAYEQRPALHRGVLVSGLLLAACFNPPNTPLTGGEDSTGPGTSTGSDTEAPACMQGETQACTCDDGATGTQTCTADGSGFGACDCGGSDTTEGTTTDQPPECTIDDDCASMASSDCEQGVCSDGTCVVEPLDAGTPCGEAGEGPCDAADSCDGAGTCLANTAVDGSTCTGCPLGACSCTAGECGDCSFASTNNFTTERSIEGWTLTGGWALYREAPQSMVFGPTPFSGQVLGTDGNRSLPYPGSEQETSSARSAPTVLPPMLQLLSWNVDEGSGSFDNKSINVSVDGGVTFQPLANCTLDPSLPFCQFREAPRDPEDWDMISIPVPPPLQGQVGIIELTYATGDSCCNFEQGWFVDALNFAGSCACASDDNCSPYGSECGQGVCGATGECELDPVAADTACGDMADVQCNAPDACDGAGYCRDNVQPTGLSTCTDCPAGAGGCNLCQEGSCVDCTSVVPVNGFDDEQRALNGWLIEDLSGSGADFRMYFEAPPNQVAGSVPIPLSTAPAFGTDGNRVQPYPAAPDPGNLEHEHSRVTTSPDLVPPQITFQSWHVDEGPTDNKIIELSVDGGLSWNELVNCQTNPMGQPFCTFLNINRPGNQWDSISLDTAAWAGMTGQLRITYNTQDACCNFERGWFIDNLNFAQYCLDPQFPGGGGAPLVRPPGLVTPG